SGAGGGFENLAVLDRRLDDPAAKSRGPQDAGSTGRAGAPREWLKPSPANYANVLKDMGQYNYAVTAAAPGMPAVSPPMPGGSPAPGGTVNLSSIPDPAPFQFRPEGQGMVVAASIDDVFKQPAEHWAWMLNSLTPDRVLWYRRHGLSAERSNPGFWSWLIEGVGLAPVSEFRILISIFVLAIGPLNYYWLRRRGKLHLLVLIVPLAALAVTGSLFGYALVADGLDVRVRSRSFTQIDQRSGRAVCWARNSYYAGLAPSALHFPVDAVVLPLLLNEGDTSDSPYRHTLLWTDDEQRLVSGWLASRTPTQFITVRSRASQAGIQFGRTDRGPQIENHLDTRILRLLLADEKGQHYRAAGVAAGARVALEAVEPGGEELEIWQYVTDHRPAVPQGYMPHMDQGFGGIRRRGAWYYNQSNMGLPAPMQETSRLEAALRTAVMGSSGRSISLKPAEFALRPRSYLAVVERSPEVVFGVEDPREENSLHVVVGSW
ncbi:MAG TPA: hypothetical protein VJ783_10700, partial [Pirellulales bacterium]|nr:hypothetical protein [Pirellulales bacterium]